MAERDQGRMTAIGTEGVVDVVTDHETCVGHAGGNVEVVLDPAALDGVEQVDHDAHGLASL